MSKKVPYRCKFGHITIIKFTTETEGIVDCETCSRINDGLETFLFIPIEGNHSRGKSLYKWRNNFTRTNDGEKAVRI